MIISASIFSRLSCGIRSLTLFPDFAQPRTRPAILSYVYGTLSPRFMYNIRKGLRDSMATLYDKG